mmetsp:Transcript_8002/g.22991  ORF Transcript_8002/g.22991 Transcript_8002/m.22991 type:complete len:201 (+) Transcript_8002:283-885(+)
MAPKSNGGGALEGVEEPNKFEKSNPALACGMPGIAPPIARCSWSMLLKFCGFIIWRINWLACSGLFWNICLIIGFCASIICRIMSGFWSTICCIIFIMTGLSSICMSCSGFGGWPIPGIAPGAQGFAAGVVMPHGLLIPVDGSIVEGEGEGVVVLVLVLCVDALPQGFGMGAPVAPSPDDCCGRAVVGSDRISWASIKGS